MNGKKMLETSVEEALSYGANCFMVYTGAPQNTRRKPIEQLNIKPALTKWQNAGMSLSNIVVHAPYIMNLANPSLEKRMFAIDFLTNEVRRTAAMGASQIVLHPGAHVKNGTENGISFIIEGLNEVIARTSDLDVKIALETMAGKGTEIGRTFEELKTIIDGIDHDERISICFDSCHTHDAGYAIKDNFDAVLKEFDKIIGIDRISVVHVNDSKNPRGAAKDRHENIGFGFIGFEALSKIVHHPALQDIPKILETPYVTKTSETKDKVYPPYKEEIKMLVKRQFNPNLLDLIRNK
jgi:deoxyribonuclease-4